MKAQLEDVAEVEGTAVLQKASISAAFNYQNPFKIGLRNPDVQGPRIEHDGKSHQLSRDAEGNPLGDAPPPGLGKIPVVSGKRVRLDEGESVWKKEGMSALQKTSMSAPDTTPEKKISAGSWGKFKYTAKLTESNRKAGNAKERYDKLNAAKKNPQSSALQKRSAGGGPEPEEKHEKSMKRWRRLKLAMMMTIGVEKDSKERIYKLNNAKKNAQYSIEKSLATELAGATLASRALVNEWLAPLGKVLGEIEVFMVYIRKFIQYFNVVVDVIDDLDETFSVDLSSFIPGFKYIMRASDILFSMVGMYEIFTVSKYLGQFGSALDFVGLLAEHAHREGDGIWKGVPVRMKPEDGDNILEKHSEVRAWYRTFAKALRGHISPFDVIAGKVGGGSSSSSSVSTLELGTGAVAMGMGWLRARQEEWDKNVQVWAPTNF